MICPLLFEMVVVDHVTRSEVNRGIRVAVREL
jgi:hypothetical protein